jgi:molybdenum cofactor cytidylyltransferase
MVKLNKAHMGEIWAVILAAGESKRMGTPKMVLPFNGSTMIENVIDNITRSKADNTLVVLGAEKGRLSQLTGILSVDCCYNDNYKEGMLSSVKCGFRNIPSGTRAVMVFQGDQPLITPVVINSVIEAYLSSEKGIIIPVFNNRRGHPVLIDIKYKDEIEQLNTDKGLRSLAYKFPDDILEVSTEEPGILRDFDTFDQYLKEINQIR